MKTIRKLVLFSIGLVVAGFMIDGALEMPYFKEPATRGDLVLLWIALLVAAVIVQRALDQLLLMVDSIRINGPNWE